MPLGVRVPDGFALTADAYRALLDGPGVRERLRAGARRPRPDRRRRAARGRARSRAARCARRRFPPDAAAASSSRPTPSSRDQYGDERRDVAVRSSATAEDLPTASFAGQQETYLNVRGLAEL